MVAKDFPRAVPERMALVLPAWLSLSTAVDAQTSRKELQLVEVSVGNVRSTSEAVPVDCTVRVHFGKPMEMESLERRSPGEGNKYLIVTLRLKTTSRREVNVMASELALAGESGSKASGRLLVPLSLSDEDRVRLALPAGGGVWSGSGVSVSRSGVTLYSSCQMRLDPALSAAGAAPASINTRSPEGNVDVLFEVPKTATGDLKLMLGNRQVGTVPSK